MNKSSNKKELLIHAGYPRCASSFLQDKVFNNFKDIYYVNRNKEFRTLIKQFNYRAEFGENIREKYFNLFFPGLKNKAIVSDEQFIGSIFSGCSNASMILENIVYLELLRRGYKIWTGTLRNAEIDFIAKNRNGEIEYYQVAWEISNAKTEDREFTSLEKVKDNYPKILLSTESFPQNRAGITHKNVFDWLLENENQ